MKKAVATLLPGAFWLLLSLPAIAGQGNDPQSWLDRMTAAMSQMTYQGTFVYVQGDELQTMRITHVSDENGVRERLVSLSGSKSEVIRDADGVLWIPGDGRSVLSDSAYRRSYFPEMPLQDGSPALESYTVELGGDALIAGHNARVVKVLPRDHYRYGYTLWLEKHSGLLLKWELFDTRRKPLAKLMFTDLSLGPEVDQTELKSKGELKELETVKSRLPTASTVTSRKPRWQPTKLPPGFVLTSHRYVASGDNDGGEYEHLVYSDGLAAVSVYVESPQDGKSLPEMTHQHGTSNAFICSASGMVVTVVGDVPAPTVAMIGKSVETSLP